MVEKKKSDEEEKIIEEWKLIEGTDNYYISNMGRVKKGRKLKKLHKNVDGYYMCYIEKKKCKVHRLVAQAFVPNLEPNIRNVVDHIDGNKENNKATNLRWATIRENVQFAFQNNQIDLKGSYNCLMIDEENNMTLYKTQAIVAQVLGVDAKTISEASRGKIKQVKGYRFMRVKEFIDKRDWDGK